MEGKVLEPLSIGEASIKPEGQRRLGEAGRALLGGFARERLEKIESGHIVLISQQRNQPVTGYLRQSSGNECVHKSSVRIQHNHSTVIPACILKGNGGKEGRLPLSGLAIDQEMKMKRRVVKAEKPALGVQAQGKSRRGCRNRQRQERGTERANQGIREGRVPPAVGKAPESNGKEKGKRNREQKRIGQGPEMRGVMLNKGKGLTGKKDAQKPQNGVQGTDLQNHLQSISVPGWLSHGSLLNWKREVVEAGVLKHSPYIWGITGEKNPYIQVFLSPVKRMPLPSG